MTGNMELLYWQSDENWYEYNQDTREYTLTELAPDRAIESFESWKEYNENSL